MKINKLLLNSLVLKKQQMLNSETTYFSKNKIIINKKNVVYILAIIAFCISLVFVDFYFLPKAKTNDVLSYHKIKYMSNRGNRFEVDNKYFTRKGFSFTTEQNSLTEVNLEIEHTFLFKYVTKVKTKDKDYSAVLINNICGMQFYLYCFFLFSIIISLIILLSGKSYSKNTFDNIICFNSFMLFLCICIAYIY